jgi:transposase
VFIKHIIKNLKEQTFKSVSKNQFISAPTVVSYMKSSIEIIKTHDIVPSKRICIDEHSYSGRKNMKMTIGDPDTGDLISVLKDRSKIRLENFLKGSNTDDLREVCVDMHRGYINSLKEVVPKAKIVIDHFHVIKELNRSLDEMRKIIQTG